MFALFSNLFLTVTFAFSVPMTITIILQGIQEIQTLLFKHNIDNKN